MSKATSRRRSAPRRSFKALPPEFPPRFYEPDERERHLQEADSVIDRAHDDRRKLLPSGVNPGAWQSARIRRGASDLRAQKIRRRHEELKGRPGAAPEIAAEFGVSLSTVYRALRSLS